MNMSLLSSILGGLFLFLTLPTTSLKAEETQVTEVSSDAKWRVGARYAIIHIPFGVDSYLTGATKLSPDFEITASVGAKKSSDTTGARIRSEFHATTATLEGGWRTNTSMIPAVGL